MNRAALVMLQIPTMVVITMKGEETNGVKHRFAEIRADRKLVITRGSSKRKEPESGRPYEARP